MVADAAEAMASRGCPRSAHDDGVFMIGVPLPLLPLLLLLFWLTDLNKRGRKEQTGDIVQRKRQKRRKFDLTFSLPCFFVAVAPRFQAPFLSGTRTCGGQAGSSSRSSRKERIGTRSVLHVLERPRDRTMLHVFSSVAATLQTTSKGVDYKKGLINVRNALSTGQA